MLPRAPNVRHFAALAATVRHGTVTQAARSIHLSQPALTQAISGLEASLSVQLFERTVGGMRPTEAARLLASRAETAIDYIGSPRVTGTQLRAFLAVARSGSYAAAAKATGLAAASLHRAVADLSLALGQRLVERRGKGISLTAAGSRRARSFGLALAELHAGLAEIAANHGKPGARIAIGAMPLSRARWLPETIARFHCDHPNVHIAVHEGSHAELAGPLRDGDIDLMLGALRDDAEVHDLAQEAVFEDHLALIMRAGHPLVTASDTAATLFEYPWLLPARGTPLRRIWEEMVRALDREPPDVAIECGSVMMLRQLLLGGDSLTLLSRDQVSIELAAGVLAALSPPVPVVRRIGITTRESWRPTGVQARFVQALREAPRPGSGLGREC